MADSVELRASVNSIKRVDPYVKEILFTATHVALYKFNIGQSQWEKAEIEGAMFLYSRNGEPYHSIMILNRLHKENFIEPLIRGFDYQMHLPFLLYRNYKSKIFGIWFFNRDECIQVAELIKSLMEKDTSDDRLLRLTRQPNGQGNMDIYSMLVKAQQDFNRTPTKQESQPPAFSSTPRILDVTPKSVMDFFAKASSNNTQKTPATGENMLHQLMSNPVHSVEHIEKQQRSVTPQEQTSLRGDAGGSERRSVPINLPGLSGKLDNFEGNGATTSGISPPRQPLASSPLNYLMQQSLHAQQEDSIEVLGTSPFAQFLESAQKPLLMTPMMFTNPNSKEKPTETKTEPIEMLTERQLAQALIYLLKNNQDFIKQIHQAYTNSILEKVDKPKDGASI